MNACSNLRLDCGFIAALQHRPESYQTSSKKSSVFVKLLKTQESIPSLAGRYDNPILRTGPPGYIGRRVAEWIPGLLTRLRIRAQ